MPCTNAALAVGKGGRESQVPRLLMGFGLQINDALDLDFLKQIMRHGGLDAKHIKGLLLFCLAFIKKFGMPARDEEVASLQRRVEDVFISEGPATASALSEFLVEMLQEIIVRIDEVMLRVAEVGRALEEQAAV